MAIVEMAIDSVRCAMLSNEWVVLLKEKSTERYLPVYVGQSQADVIKRELMGEPCHELVDDEFFTELDRVLAMADLASLVIDNFKDGIYHVKFNVDWYGKSRDIECPVGKALALVVKARAHILVEETVLNRFGIILETATIRS